MQTCECITLAQELSSAGSTCEMDVTLSSRRREHISMPRFSLVVPHEQSVTICVTYMCWYLHFSEESY